MPYDPGLPFKKESSFGSRPDPFNSSKTEYHTGIDYSAPQGTPIPAASAGTVVYSQFNNGGFGNAVIVKSIGGDGQTYYTLYGHMNGQAMPAYGDPISQGQTIGQVGNTGKSTGPHLHFEVIDGNAPINDRNDGGGSA
jgi:murein DD-endopeptidase MepM/ murein hydrolase activator NlpD